MPASEFVERLQVGRGVRIEEGAGLPIDVLLAGARGNGRAAALDAVLCVVAEDVERLVGRMVAAGWSQDAAVIDTVSWWSERLNEAVNLGAWRSYQRAEEPL